MEYVNNDQILFLFLNLDMVPKNLTQEGSPAFDKVSG